MVTLHLYIVLSWRYLEQICEDGYTTNIFDWHAFSTKASAERFIKKDKRADSYTIEEKDVEIRF